MREWKSQSHVKWYCKYHIVFSPKYRKKAMFGSLRKGVGKILRELCNQSGVELVEGHAMSDHVHLCLSIPPKYSVANTVGFLKGKSAIRIHREYLGRTRNFTGFHFWARGYCVSNGGSRRGRYSGLHPQPGGRGKTPRAAKPQGALAPFRTVEAPSRGLHQTTRFAGGS